jgi:hypothetical protein
MYANTQREELSRNALVRQAVGVNARGRRYFKDAADAERFIAERDVYARTHAEVASLTLLERVEYVTFIVGLFCIYGIDLLLFGTSAQYIAGLLSGEGDGWASVGKYVVPACFLGVEVLIALKIARSQYEEQFGFGGSAARVFWIAIGALVALVMPLAATATARSVGVVADNNVPVLMIVVLAIISFAAHVLVLFAGRMAQEAKTYVTFAMVYASKRNRAQRAVDAAKADIAVLNSLFISYAHTWRAHNARYTLMPSGPFDREVVELLKRQFPNVACGARDASFPTVAEEAS